MIKGRWHLRFAGSLCWKSSQRKLSLSLSSVDFGYGFEIIFGRLHASYFLAELKIVYVIDNTRRALNCSVFLWIQRYFPRLSVSDRFAPSYRSCFVAVPQVALSLYSHDAFSYFYSRVFVIVFKITDVPPRAVLLLSLVLSLRAFLSLYCCSTLFLSLITSRRAVVLSSWSLYSKLFYPGCWLSVKRVTGNDVTA